jgi:transposase
MIRVQCEKWNHTPEDLRMFALTATHSRTRERFLALYEVAAGSYATAVARKTNRSDEAILSWIHKYNEHGPEALQYARTGGRPPFVQSNNKTSQTYSKKQSTR